MQGAGETPTEQIFADVADVADAAEVASFVLSQRLTVDSVDVKLKTLKLIKLLAHQGQQPGRRRRTP